MTAAPVVRGCGVLCAALLAAVLAAAAAASAGAPRPIPDCLGHPVVHPRTVVLACADAGFLVSKLHWRGAVGTGVAAVNDCTPTCVAGHVHKLRIRLTARGAQRCHGVVAYRSVAYRFLVPEKLQPATGVYPRPCRA